jgi:hypothetical protein
MIVGVSLTGALLITVAGIGQDGKVTCTGASQAQGAIVRAGVEETDWARKGKGLAGALWMPGGGWGTTDHLTVADGSKADLGPVEGIGQGIATSEN